MNKLANFCFFVRRRLTARLPNGPLADELNSGSFERSD